jgi:cytochrome c-type biogenesis protein CcmH/NrfG
LGEAYKRNGKKKEALENYEKAVQLDPKNEHATYILQKLKGESK